MGIHPLSTSGARRAVFLDRDGVINAITLDAEGVPHPPHSLDQFRLLPGVVEACEALHAAGWLLIVVTNQPDVARGTQTLEVIESIHERARALLPLDEIVICPHDNVADCACRKPKPGMLTASASKWGIDLAASVMIGDRYSDILAGQAAGCRTIFIEGGALGDYGKGDRCQPDVTAPDLLTAARLILMGAAPFESDPNRTTPAIEGTTS